ncbi:hypothetical protein ACFQX7_28540 [Luedemannella flava]
MTASPTPAATAQPRRPGHGYALIAAALFGARHPGHGVRFGNRGIGGDRVRDLRKRWTEDLHHAAPRRRIRHDRRQRHMARIDSGDVTSTEDYENDYREIRRPPAWVTDGCT